jgi:curved DNA-binding protein CbpA
VGAAAASVFKRAVEAYNILSKPDLRIRYDVTLASGKLRMNPEDALPEKAKPEVRTLEMIALTEAAKKHARKADRLLAMGNLEAARIALVDATREDHGNDELKERLRWIYEAIAMS